MAIRILSAALVAALLALGCGRSDQNPGFTPDQKARLDGVITLSGDVVNAVGQVNPAGPTVVDQLVGLDARVTTVEGQVGTLEGDVAELNLRIQPNGDISPLDTDVLINDRVAAGFDAAENVDNLREALIVLNNRLDIQGAQITALDTTVTTRIQAAIDQVIADRIVPLEQAPRGFILGASTTTTDGDAGGLAGATSICQADFAQEPSAHLCTSSEVQHAVSTGQIDVAAVIDEVATWTVPHMTAVYDSALGDYALFHYDNNATSLTMSCNNLSYNVAEGVGAVAEGSSLTVDLNFGGAGSDVYIVRPAVSCDTQLSLLCCR